MTNRFTSAPKSVPGVDDAAREERHKVIIDLLAGYVDGELTPELAAQIDAHLVGCDRCRREVAVQESLREMLRRLPTEAASLSLRERIDAAVMSVPAPTPIGRAANVSREKTSRLMLILVTCIAVAILAVAGGLYWNASRGSVVIPTVRELSVSAESIPLFEAILADYEPLATIDLPGRARDLATVRSALPFAVRPLENRRLRLLGVWTTDLRGDPAAVLAYRFDDHLVVQYVVSDQAFFRNPMVRRAVSAGHVVAASGTASKILAWPEENAASVLVGDVPAKTLESLRTGRQ